MAPWFTLQFLSLSTKTLMINPHMHSTDRDTWNIAGYQKLSFAHSTLSRAINVEFHDSSLCQTFTKLILPLPSPALQKQKGKRGYQWVLTKTIPLYGFQLEEGTIISSNIKFDPTITLSGFHGPLNAFVPIETATKLETYFGFKVQTKH